MSNVVVVAGRNHIAKEYGVPLDTGEQPYFVDKELVKVRLDCKLN
jgi:hypothetical protein